MESRFLRVFVRSHLKCLNMFTQKRETRIIYVGGDACGSGADLLDIVVAQGTAILKLLAGEDETLLVGRDAFFVLDLAFHVVDGVGGLDLEGNGLTR